jgi:hypothetical protein
MLNAAIAEIPQKRIPRAQRQESQCWTFAIVSFWKKSVYYFKRSPIASNGNKFTIAIAVSSPG